MPPLKLLLNLAIGLLLHEAVLAEDHGKDKPAASSEQNKEAEGKSGKKVELLPEYFDLQFKMAAIVGKIKVKEDSIQKLIQEKKHATEQSKIKLITTQIVTEHKELKGFIQDYEKIRTKILYRFPEKNRRDKREYNRFEIKSVEQMESEIGIDAKLDKTLIVMRKQFGEESLDEKQRSVVKINKKFKKEKSKDVYNSGLNEGSIIIEK